MAKKKSNPRFHFFPPFLMIFFITIIFSSHCFASSKPTMPTENLSREEAKEIQKEAKKIGNKSNQTIIDHLQSLSKDKKLLRKTQDAFLAKEDEGKTFDRKEAKETMDDGVFPASKIEEILTVVRVNPPLDENDELFLQAKQALTSHPELTLSTETVPEEKILETCEEGGTYARIFEQKLVVTVIPEIKESKKICKGHNQNFVSKYPTKKSIKELEKTIKKNVGDNIELLDLQIDGRNVNAFYHHKNPDIAEAISSNKIHTTRIGCFNYQIAEKIIREKEETDTWVLVRWRRRNA